MTERPDEDDANEKTEPTVPPTPDGRDGEHPHGFEFDRPDRIPIDPDRTDTGGSTRDDEIGTTGDEDATGDDDDEYRYPEPSSTPVEPGAVEPEHAAFVVLGALAMLAVLARIAGIAF